ncbi:hypothetical protein ACCO45_012580 [Purpureocillium lilacinum]|uniref:Uncharacterized protein n=1 Tax=Purpureocillium lilacinum TaxID=33203 RepID=A0ACC4D9Z9_PURLI
MIGNTIIQGFANSLDTLAGQAFGSGNKHLVGIHTQRMVYFILLCTAPLMALWWKAGDVLAPVLPDRELAELTGLYLRIMILRVPAFVLFECGKRYAQAQGIFNAATYVLLLVAPFNACLMWALVWHLGWGFIGGPIAIVFTENLMALLLFLYLWLIDGYQCWGGFSKKALSNWITKEPMMRLAIPGMVMHVAEFAADEILTIACAQFGAAQLAAQSALVTLTQITWTVPLAISIAASIRVANLIGAKATDAATMAAVVVVVLGLIVTTLCTVLTAALRYHIPYWFTDDMEVVSIITKALPIVMVMQFFDATSAISHGLMRGIGYQEFGGYLNLVAYNLIAIPISFSTAFLLHWQIYGLWTGIAVGLGM